VVRAKLTAIVLRSVDTGEADRVVTLLSRERGKVAAYARGARASRRRFGGALEPFTLVRAEVRERPGADLLGLESLAVVDGFAGIRGDLARIACAAYAAELARDLVRDHEPHEDLFDLLGAYLGALGRAAASPTGLRAFELGALRAAGLLPRLDACARCGAPHPPLPDPLPPPERGEREGRGGDVLRLDPAHGGVLCEACSDAARGAPALSAETAAALARLAEGGLAAAAEPLPARAGREARDALGAFIEHHLGHRLAARRFLEEVGHLLAHEPPSGTGSPSPPASAGGDEMRSPRRSRLSTGGPRGGGGGEGG
jgi:DNA repair protein RecO (recombination protein O)